MKRVSRRTFVGGSLAAAGTVAAESVLGRRARAAEFTYKYANNAPVTHPMNLAAEKMAQRIREESKGRLEIQIFPNNQLGGDTDMLSQLRSGAIEMFTLSGLVLATLVPTASINGIGFAWKDYDAVWGGMDGELGAYVRAQIAKAGLHAFEKMWDNGYRQITSSTHPIATAEDLKGFKIRVPVSPLWTSMFEAFGASPASINFNEVYSALQTKIVEGQENPLTLIQIAKLYEVQKYCSLTSHMWDGFWFLANAQAWQALPKDLQEIAERNINLAALDQRAQLQALSQSVQDDLKGKGMIFNKPDPEAFRAVLQKAKFYENWKAKYGAEAWALLEKYTGKLV
ncbi:MAG: TRAP transporter substrate-binding protein [Alphaproteobacteria bacterium]|nr:TRAP transporter substrate-binding protein [Alphaproteobacteria bacterium]